MADSKCCSLKEFQVSLFLKIQNINEDFKKNTQSGLIWKFGWHSIFFFFFSQIHQMSFVDKIKVIKSVIDVNYIGELSWD